MEKIIRSYFEDDEIGTCDDGTYKLEFPDRYADSYKDLIENAAKLCDCFMLGEYEDADEVAMYNNSVSNFFGKGFIEVHFDELKEFGKGCSSTLKDHVELLMKFGVVSEWKLTKLETDIYNVDYGFMTEM